MKKIINKVTEMPQADGLMTTYANLITFCVKGNIPEWWLDVVEMAKRMRVLDALENIELEEEINIEDADFETIKALATVNKWAIIHKDLIDFVKYIKEEV